MDDSKFADQQLTSDLKSANAGARAASVLEVIGGVLAVIGLISGMIPLLIIGTLLAFGGGALASRQKKQLKQSLGDRLVRSVLEEAFPGVQYDPAGHISSSLVQSSHLILPVTYQQVSGSDDIKAVYRGMNIEFSDIALLEEIDNYDSEMNTFQTTTSTQDVFHCQWIICDLGRALPTEVQVAVRSKIQRVFRGKGLKTGNEEFDKCFFIQSSCEERTFSVLTPRMTEQILSASCKFGGNLYLSFLPSGLVHIVVRSGRDFFEFGKGATNAAALRQRIHAEIAWITGIIDELGLTGDARQEASDNDV